MEQDTTSEAECNKSYLDELKRLNAYVNRMVNVSTVKDCLWSGWVNSIDPISKSVILSVAKGGYYEAVLIPGHAILEISETYAEHPCPVRKPTQLISTEDLCSRKTRIAAWLKKNLLPVVENKDSLEVGDVKILPPFTVNEICTDNIVIATQIRKLLEKMPDDFVI